MKRSEINLAIERAVRYFKKARFPLPPFAFWTSAEWKKNLKKADEIVKTGLGWDVTDFGSGDFNKMGRTIFTLRNGLVDSSKYNKPYSQKVMFTLTGQKSPIHYHKRKMEDIVNHFGGLLIVRLWKKTKNDKLSNSKVKFSLDGIEKTVKSGEQIRLKPGQSVCIKPGMYHQFWAEKKSEPVVSVEVGSVNDDADDNYWYKKGKRFPKIEEDVSRKFVLCNEYNLIK